MTVTILRNAASLPMREAEASHRPGATGINLLAGAALHPLYAV